MTTPALEAIRRATGQPPDVIAGGAAGYGALEALRDNPDINQLISRADGNWWVRCLQLWRIIRAGGYKVVVVLPSIPAYRWTARLAGVPCVIYVPPSPPRAHLASHMSNAVAAQLGVAPGPLQLTLPVASSARARVSQLLGGLPKQIVVGLNIGATRPQKRWPNQSFAFLAARLTARGYSVVLIGGPGDKVDADEIAGLLDGRDSLLNLCGKTTIAELGALVERCDIMVTGDSGAMHIAAAVGTPLVALFGSTDPAQTGPVGKASSRVIYKKLHCAPCKSHPTCGGRYDCMKSISPAEVLSAVQEILGHEPAYSLPVLGSDLLERER